MGSRKKTSQHYVTQPLQEKSTEPNIFALELNKGASDEQCESLRPKTFDEYPGQERVCENLKIYTEAAKRRKKMLDHCLFHGPPGLGKTTLAGIIAHTMGCTMKVTSGPVIERAGDLMGLLASLEPMTILFIDEIHRLPANIEEILYTAMEDHRLDVLIGQGPNTRTIKLDLPPFTLIAATTRPGALSAPLRDRFGIVERLDYYTPEALQKIILRSARILGISITEDAAIALARRSRGTPRIANMLLRRAADFALVANHATITITSVEQALERLGIDHAGLSPMDRAILFILRDRYNGGPAGLDAIAAALQEERSTLEDVYEPYLVAEGYIARTPRGRVLLPRAIEHLSHIESEKKFTFLLRF